MIDARIYAMLGLTQPAVSKAVQLSVDTIELDIRITADNEAVVYHDSRLNPVLISKTDRYGNFLFFSHHREAILKKQLLIFK